MILKKIEKTKSPDKFRANKRTIQKRILRSSFIRTLARPDSRVLPSVPEFNRNPGQCDLVDSPLGSSFGVYNRWGVTPRPEDISIIYYFAKLSKNFLALRSSSFIRSTNASGESKARLSLNLRSVSTLICFPYKSPSKSRR